jgi:hypothetical protein
VDEQYAGQVANPSRLSTSVLLTCAAIGVAAGVLQAGAGAISAPVSAAAPILYGLILGVHVLPGVIAQELLRAPWVALITHLIAALVASAVVPVWIGRYVGTALLIGGLQELIAAASRYRRWEPWRFFLSAVIIGGSQPMSRASRCGARWSTSRSSSSARCCGRPSGSRSAVRSAAPECRAAAAADPGFSHRVRVG